MMFFLTEIYEKVTICLLITSILNNNDNNVKSRILNHHNNVTPRLRRVKILHYRNTRTFFTNQNFIVKVSFTINSKTISINSVSTHGNVVDDMMCTDDLEKYNNDSILSCFLSSLSYTFASFVFLFFVEILELV